MITVEELQKEKAYFDKKAEYFASIQFQNLARDFTRAADLIEKIMSENLQNDQIDQTDLN